MREVGLRLDKSVLLMIGDLRCSARGAPHHLKPSILPNAVSNKRVLALALSAFVALRLISSQACHSLYSIIHNPPASLFPGVV